MHPHFYPLQGVMGSERGGCMLLFSLAVSPIFPPSRYYKLIGKATTFPCQTRFSVDQVRLDKEIIRFV